MHILHIFHWITQSFLNALISDTDTVYYTNVFVYSYLHTVGVQVSCIEMVGAEDTGIKRTNIRNEEL